MPPFPRTERSVSERPSKSAQFLVCHLPHIMLGPRGPRVSHRKNALEASAQSVPEVSRPVITSLKVKSVIFPPSDPC